MTRRKIIRFSFLTIGALVALYVLVYVGGIVFRTVSDDRVNAQHLNTLEADQLLKCQVAGVSPLPAKDDNSAGSKHGIGFGSVSPTLVARDFSLNGADPTAVMATFANCAQAAAWSVKEDPVVAGQDLTLSGVKRFPDGWTTSLLITVRVSKTPSSWPDIEIQLED